MAQPSIPGTDVGKVGIPFGSDGSSWIALLVDALGRLQVDAVIDNVPSDLATQTTLAGIQALIGALSNPDAGTMNKHLLDLVTRMGATGGGDAGTLLAFLNNIQTLIGALTNPSSGTTLTKYGSPGLSF